MSIVSKTPAGRPIPVPFTEQRKFIVDVSVFALRDDKYPGKYVPADFFAELIRKEVIKEAHRTVRDAMLLQCHPADINQPVLGMRAKVEVRLNLKAEGAIGLSVLTGDQAKFLFRLRDEIIEIIEELKPPKSAWVLIGGKPKAPEPGVQNDRPAALDKPARARTHSSRRRIGSRPRKSTRPAD